MNKNSKPVSVLLAGLLVSFISYSQIKVVKVAIKDLPANISYKGKYSSASKWSDQEGEHIVLLTETGLVASKSNPEEGNRQADLYAYHFLLAKDSVRQKWLVHDLVRDCPVDVIAQFVKNSFVVTDLDKDGLSEIWLMYQVSCQGDVSPVPMKIIMYEGSQKFAIRGTSKVQVSEKETAGGEFSLDDAFKKAPTSFREYGQQLWKKFVVQKWE